MLWNHPIYKAHGYTSLFGSYVQLPQEVACMSYLLHNCYATALHFTLRFYRHTARVKYLLQPCHVLAEMADITQKDTLLDTSEALDLDMMETIDSLDVTT